MLSRLVASPRATLWSSIALAALSWPFNVAVWLYTWVAIRAAAGDRVASFLPVLIPMSLLAHIGLFLGLRGLVVFFLRNRSARARTLASVCTALGYSAVVIGFLAWASPIGSL